MAFQHRPSRSLEVQMLETFRKHFRGLWIFCTNWTPWPWNHQNGAWRIRSAGCNQVVIHCSSLACFSSIVSLIECWYKLPNFRFRFLAIRRDINRQIPYTEISIVKYPKSLNLIPTRSAAVFLSCCGLLGHKANWLIGGWNTWSVNYIRWTTCFHRKWREGIAKTTDLYNTYWWLPPRYFEELASKISPGHRIGDNVGHHTHRVHWKLSDLLAILRNPRLLHIIGNRPDSSLYYFDRSYDRPLERWMGR